MIDSVIKVQYDTEENTQSLSDRLTPQSVRDVDNKVCSPKKIQDINYRVDLIIDKLGFS